MSSLEAWFKRIFINNWQRKGLAILAALVVWLFVNSSINETKTIPNVPMRVINLPSDRTIVGLLPNGILGKRVTLTLTGTKDIIQDLEAGDLMVILDASTADSDDWIVQITKKNLLSLNPAIDLSHHVTQVSHPDFVIKLSKLITAKIPLTILPPLGDPPQGYVFLDIWPQKLTQTLSGPEEEIQKLKNKGLEITFDLNQITKADLDSIKSPQQNNEVSYSIPNRWKHVAIPFRSNVMEDLNDSEAQNLEIDFLRKEFLPLDAHLPIRVFFPLKYSDKLNPETYSLSTGAKVEKKNDLFIYNQNLFVFEVSRLFLEVIKGNLGLVLIAAPKSEREVLQWCHEVVNPRELEDTYVAFMMTNHSALKSMNPSLIKKKEISYRKRFREYYQRLTLYVSPDQKLSIESMLDSNRVYVK